MPTAGLYRCLLRLYPSAYARRYREPMEQAFRDQLRAAGSRRERFQVIAAALADLARSIPAVYSQERNLPMKSLKPHGVALFIVMILFLGRFELHSDDTGMVLFFTLLFAFVLAYLQPAWARLWALVGLCVPLAHIVIRPGHVVVERQPAHLSPVDLALIALLMVAVGSAGSFVGSRLRRSMLPSGARPTV